QSNPPTSGTTLISMGQRMSVLNASATRPDPRASILTKPYGMVQDHLAEADSTLSNNYYYFKDSRRIGLFDLEHDPMIPGGYMSGVGQRVLMQVLKPEPDARLVLDLSTTVMKGKPLHAVLIGKSPIA